MPLDTYSHLQIAILNWLARPGDATISTSVPDMILLFEAEARRRLFTRFNETTTTLTTTPQTATVALPLDFVELRSIKVSSSDPVVKLTYVTPEEMDETWVSVSAQTGPEIAYTIEGLNLRLAPTPQSADTLTIGYLQGVPGLASLVSVRGATVDPTNWLLTNHPDLYLFGSLAEAEAFIGHDEPAALWKGRRDELFESILVADRKARWGGGSLQIKTDVGNP